MNSGMEDTEWWRPGLKNLACIIELEAGIALNIAVWNGVIVKSVPESFWNSDTEIFVLASLNEQASAELLLSNDFGCLVNRSLLLTSSDVILNNEQ